VAGGEFDEADQLFMTADGEAVGHAGSEVFIGAAVIGRL
jgi:hypothetical protein